MFNNSSCYANDCSPSLVFYTISLYHYIDTVLFIQQTVFFHTSNLQHIEYLCWIFFKKVKDGSFMTLDRRKKFTRMVLKDSLMTLLKEKQISAITVKEICALADINRSTYYSHYSDQYDLLAKIEEELIDDMYDTLIQYNFTKEEESLQMTEKILEYIAAKNEVCKTLLSEHGDTNFQKRIMHITQQFTTKNWGSMNNNIDQKLSEYISMFVVSGSIYVIKSWLDNGMDKSPKEMAKIINDFSNKGLSSILNDESSS